MKVTSKGQVTIPQEVREQADIRPGDDVDFVVDDEGVRLVKAGPAENKGKRTVEALRRHGQRVWATEPKMTTDELMQLLRGD
ncbi:MAG: AbrB/MazE/SpoVT family DNA-binding domain-containing protein [Mycobacterium sp.]|nr:AbrB/MazE/SpoVT family DNA-binding domain-containing protein [Mycobacterium sp.]